MIEINGIRNVEDFNRAVTDGDLQFVDREVVVEDEVLIPGGQAPPQTHEGNSWGALEQIDTTSRQRVDSSPTGADMSKGPVSQRFFESVRAHSIFAAGAIASGVAVALTTIARENSRRR